MRSWVAIAALAAGCWTQRPAAEPAPPVRPAVAAVERPAQPWPASGRTYAPRREIDRCAESIDHFFEMVATDVQTRVIPAGMVEELHGVMIESCHETGWSDESLACYAAATSTSDAGNCFQAMTAEQRADFDGRFSEIRKRYRSGPPPSASSPSP